MGKVRIPNKVLLMTAVCCNSENMEQIAVEKLTGLFGPVEDRTSPFNFSHTHYYQEEMGNDLTKFYLTFTHLIDPSQIADIKLATNTIEDELSLSGSRNVNLDPGYIEVPKLVLATTKNFSHRVYINKGIYGDVQLYWQAGTFHANPWTYPDYVVPANLAFFNQQRQRYFKRIQEENL